MNGPFIYRGSRAICDAVGINFKEITYYKEKHGLPVFKIQCREGRRTQWLALPDDLENWVKKQRDLYLQK